MSNYVMGPLQSGLPYRRQQYSYDEEFRQDLTFDYEPDMIGEAAIQWPTAYGEQGQALYSCVSDPYASGVREISWRDICFEARMEADRKRGIYPISNCETSEFKEWLLADIMTTKKYSGVLAFAREQQWRRAEISSTELAANAQGARRSTSEIAAQGRRTRFYDPVTEPGSEFLYSADNERRHGVRGVMPPAYRPSFFR